MPSANKSAFIVVNGGVEKTVKEWVEALKDETNQRGSRYTKSVIEKYATQEKFGFRYKKFENLPEEEWKFLDGSKNHKGEWYISTEGRIKYKTKYAENVLSAECLCTHNGYPTISFGKKILYCHILSFKTFYPEKYAAKKDDDEILHINDDKLDFRPTMLYLGSKTQNRLDAYNNGSYDNTKIARKPVVSYVDGVLEKEHESLSSAIKYLKDNGFPSASATNVGSVVGENKIRYGRTWE
jgi:hypothetical protein